MLLLFVIGLELNLSRLWSMRRDIFGLGTAQIAVSGALIALYPYFVVGRSLPASIVAGLGLALSSTALVMQLLEERREVEAPHGRTAFAVLLMQDLAIVPLLALVAFLSPLPRAEEGPVWVAVLEMLAAVAAVVLTGRFLLSPLFGLLARSGAREIMTAAALLVVLGAAGLMAAVGLSMATGAFLAGLLLAESSYRHELEADIEPFRGLLLGLFFLSVGMSVDLGVVRANIGALLAAATVLTLTKAVAMYGVSRAFGHSHPAAVRAALLLAQGGEFGFVLYATAAAAQVMTADHATLLVALVTLSMALTPLVVRLAPLFIRGQPGAAPEEDFSDARGSVLVIGFGRVGQLVAQVLLRRGVALTIIDSDVEQIEAAARFGARVHYGDGTRLDVLRAAGAGTGPAHRRLHGQAGGHGPRGGAPARDLPGHAPRRALLRPPPRAAPARDGSRWRCARPSKSALALGREALVSLGVPEDDAEAVEREVRRRDRERLDAQAAGIPTVPGEPFIVRPEPLEAPSATRVTAG